MPVGTKRLGLAVAALILAATCAFLIVALLMPADSVRDAVKAEIRAVTGLEPVVRGRRLGVALSKRQSEPGGRDTWGQPHRRYCADG